MESESDLVLAIVQYPCSFLFSCNFNKRERLIKQNENCEGGRAKRNSILGIGWIFIMFEMFKVYSLLFLLKKKKGLVEEICEWMIRKHKP